MKATGHACRSHDCLGSGIGAPPTKPASAFLTSASMATQTTSVTRTAGLLTVIAVLGATALSACTPRPDGPEPTAEQFFAALATGDTAAAAALSRSGPRMPRPPSAKRGTGLQATRLDAQILGSKYAEDTGSVTYRYTWHLPQEPHLDLRRCSST